MGGSWVVGYIVMPGVQCRSWPQRHYVDTRQYF